MGQAEALKVIEIAKYPLTCREVSVGMKKSNGSTNVLLNKLIKQNIIERILIPPRVYNKYGRDYITHYKLKIK